MAYIHDMESAFEIIAEPNRRAILILLASSEQSVGEIERQLRMSQPAVSKHLRVLRDVLRMLRGLHYSVDHLLDYVFSRIDCVIDANHGVRRVATRHNKDQD